LHFSLHDREARGFFIKIGRAIENVGRDSAVGAFLNEHKGWQEYSSGDLTQQKLADEVGASRQTIVAIEKGNYSPSLELAFKLALVFKTPIQDVFTYEPD